jgi:hypothetical protein
MTEKNKWLNPDHIRLMAGEMTASEMRCVLAVIGPIVAELEAARLDAERYRIACKFSDNAETLYAAVINNEGDQTEINEEFDAAIAQQKGKT